MPSAQKIQRSPAQIAAINETATVVKQTLADAIAACLAGDVAVGNSVEWREFEAESRRGGNVGLLIDAGSPEARPTPDGGLIHHVGQAGLYLICFTANKVATLEQFGCKMDGSDETDKFRKALNSGLRIEQNSGHISLSTLIVSNTCSIKMGGTAKITMLKTAFVPLISINPGAENSHLEFNCYVDGNFSSRSFVALNAAGSTAFVHNIANITADEGSTESVSAVEVNVANCKFLVDGRDFENTGQPNESVPRLVSIQNTAKDYYGFLVRGRNIQGGVTTGAPTGRGHIEVVDIDGIHDNGIYNIGDGLSLGEVIYKGGEEAVVNKGRLVSCRKITHIGAGHSPLNIDDAEFTNVDEILLVRDLDTGETPKSAFILRGTNVSSGYVRIGKITGECKGTQLFAAPTDAGSIDHLILEGCNIDFFYTGDTVLSSWMNVQAAKRYDIKDVRVKFIDTTDSLAYNNRPQFALPPLLEQPSTIRNVDLNATLADGITKSPVEMRISNLCIEHCYHEGMRLQANSGPYGREIEFGVPNSVFSYTNMTARGWWRDGEDYCINGASSAPFRVRVTASGNPASIASY